MFEAIESFLTQNSQLAWAAVFAFAFLESFILSGLIISSAILFSVCVFVYSMGLMPLYAIVPMATLGAHLGDMSGFLFGKKGGYYVVKRNQFLSRKT